MFRGLSPKFIETLRWKPRHNLGRFATQFMYVSCSQRLCFMFSTTTRNPRSELRSRQKDGPEWIRPQRQTSCLTSFEIVHLLYQAEHLLERAGDLASFQARSANLHALRRAIDFSAYSLQIWEPTPLVMRVIVRAEEGVVSTYSRSFAADITTLSH